MQLALPTATALASAVLNSPTGDGQAIQTTSVGQRRSLRPPGSAHHPVTASAPCAAAAGHWPMCTAGQGKISASYRVGLVQLVRFLVVELTHLGLNSRFDMGVVFTANYSFSGRQRPRRQRCALGDRLHKSQDQAGSVFWRCS
jgi:hypothetical protein